MIENKRINRVALMKNENKIKTSIILICACIIFLLSGCQNHHKEDKIDKLMRYEGKYVGDASAVGNILALLELKYNSYQLNTNFKPYGIQIFCAAQNDKESVESKKKSYLYNSAVIFSLIKNVDEIKISYDSGQEFYFKRKDINRFFEKKTETIGNDRKSLEKNILTKLDSESIVNSFYSEYNIISKNDNSSEKTQALTYDDFKTNLTANMNYSSITEKFGVPSEDIGSGIHIYVYKLIDSSEIWIGYTDKIFYAKHMDIKHQLLENLIE